MIHWLLRTGVAFAADSTGKLQNPLGDGTSFLSVLQNVLKAITTLATPVVAIMVVIGGIQIMTARGSEEQINSGRSTITHAIVGFAIILLASAVVGIIVEIVMDPWSEPGL